MKSDWAASLVCFAICILLARNIGSACGLGLVPLPFVVSIVLLILSLVLSYQFRGGFPREKFNEPLIFHGLGVLGILYGSVISNIKSQSAESAFFQSLSVIIIGISIAHVCALNQFKKLETGIAITFAIFGLGATALGAKKLFGEMFMNAPLTLSSDGRFVNPGFTLVTDYNLFALIVLVGGLSLFYLSKFLNKFAQYFFQFVGTFMIILTPLSGSRRAMLAVIILFVMYALAKVKVAFTGKSGQSKVREAGVAGAMLVLVLIVGIALFSQLGSSANLEAKDSVTYNVLNRFQSFGELTETISQSRGDLAGQSLDIILQGPPRTFWFGEGFDYTQKLEDEDGGVGEGWPHNPVLSAWLYGGIISALVILVLLVRPLYLAYVHRATHGYMALVCFLVSGFMILSGNTYYDGVLLPFMSLWGYTLQSRSASNSGTIGTGSRRRLGL